MPSWLCGGWLEPLEPVPKKLWPSQPKLWHTSQKQVGILTISFLDTIFSFSDPIIIMYETLTKYCSPPCLLHNNIFGSGQGVLLLKEKMAGKGPSKRFTVTIIVQCHFVCTCLFWQTWCVLWQVPWKSERAKILRCKLVFQRRANIKYQTMWNG